MNSCLWIILLLFCMNGNSCQEPRRRSDCSDHIDRMERSDSCDSNSPIGTPRESKTTFPSFCGNNTCGCEKD